ncbi:restriction endonuclease subunit S [Campylobacter canadensis]|uniref:restriction endonuclease subunit S n=1 Tax=Campylobacter canadensis TaxID=449520 RepID=UPI001554BFF1|nr:restriction endonuclease subunit S [Campylobacter canadensis]MBZ7995065.1 restriction endonuclease subunit S [Campylobacter canadensis]MBZ7996659.1 restriction endonuclease subunit S [Campylobacter canadensis]MBZ8000267.1 restriction endonuclease subunit S [Campylobacter canadensis]MBZ8002289.1 restriction endonuclease subunit S [Campylobacter canadensis]MBZ8003406.1 restriction endonuclease subunit S [Campylobacter canadensis]
MIAYKESGIKWLGKIPAHWEVARVKDIFYLFKDISYIENPTVLSLTRDGVKVRDMSNLKGQFAENYNNYNKVKVGDLLLNVMDLYSGANCNVSQVDGVISPAYANLRQHKECYPKYFDYYFKMQYISKAFQAAGKGVSYEHRWTLTSEVLLNYPIPLPPLEEQKKIADFLDEKCKKIDDFVTKQAKFIELLKEQKQVLINQATTKGLDKSTELKDSHIPHLGKIPTHWEVVRLKNIAKFNRGLNITKENLKDDGVYCISYGEIHSKYPFIVNPKNHKLKCVENEYLNTNINSMLYKGDFIFADTSEDIEGSGNFTLYDGEDEAFAGYHTIIVRVDKNIFYPKFLAYEFDSKTYRNKIQSLVSGVKVFSITQAILRETEVWIPPLEEQKKIAKYLDDKCEKIDKAINNITKQISLIQEYKTSLIDTTTKGMLKELK